MMRAAAPLALTGLLGLIVLEILKIIMEPVVLWILAMLALGLKIFLILIVIAISLGVSVYFVRRYMRSREEVEV